MTFLAFSRIAERLLDSEFGAARVAHGGDPRSDGSPQVLNCLKEAVAERALEVPPQVDTGERDVDVTVEQPWKQRLPATSIE